MFNKIISTPPSTDKIDIQIEELLPHLFVDENSLAMIVRISDMKILYINKSGPTYSEEEIKDKSPMDFIKTPLDVQFVLSVLEKNYKMVTKTNIFHKDGGQSLATVELSRLNHDYLLVKLIGLYQRHQMCTGVCKNMNNSFFVVQHELNTPLNSILGFMGILKREIEDMLKEGKAHPQCLHHLEELNHAYGGAERMANTVRDLLTYFGFVLGREHAFTPSMINMEVFIKGIKGKVAHLVEQKNLKFQVMTDFKLTHFHGDEYKLKSMILYLIDNSIKFTNSGEIHLEMYLTDNLEIYVRDTGVGIDRAYMTMFEGFSPEEQVVFHKNYTRTHEGLGLGLAIASYICELHGGRLYCLKKNGSGAEFIARLPIRR